MRESDADLIAQLMALKDDTREPLTIHMRMTFARGAEPSLEVLQAASAALLARHPRLREAMQISRDGVRWVHSDAPALMARVWEHQDKSLDQFQQISIPYDQAPLWRLRYTREDGLCAALHHSLVDGRAQLLLALEFLGLAFDRELPAASLVPVGTVHRRRPSVLALLWDLVGRALQSGFAPPVFLGPLKRFGSRQVQLGATLPPEEAKGLFERVRGRFPHATWNDVLLTAFHLALGDVADARPHAGGKSRISVMTPMDLRRWVQPSQPISNWSSYVSTSTSLAQREGSAWELLRQVSRRMGTAKLLGLDYGMVWVNRVADALGLYRRGREHRLEHGVSMRARQSDSRGWRGLDTATLTNLGRLQMPQWMSERVTGFFGAPPVFPPMGVGVAVGSTNLGLHIGLRASDATLDAPSAGVLLERFVGRLRAFSVA